MSQITTHVLDTAAGRPAAGVPLTLFQAEHDTWRELASGVTNSDGRVAGLLEGFDPLPGGDFRMHFATGVYFEQQQIEIFYPWVDVVFRLDDRGEHYHIPLLLSPFGYSTYRGS